MSRRIATAQSSRRAGGRVCVSSLLALALLIVALPPSGQAQSSRRKPKVKIIEDTPQPKIQKPAKPKRKPIEVPARLRAPDERQDGRAVRKETSEIVPNSEVYRYEDNGFIAHIEGDYTVPNVKSPTDLAERFLKMYYKELGLDERYRSCLRLLFESPDRGTMVLRYEQTYQQIPILDSFITFYVSPDMILKGLDANVIPIEGDAQISAPQDPQLAINAVLEKLNSELSEQVELEDFPSAKLAVRVLQGAPRSQWVIGFNTVNPPVYWNAIVDADSNRVISLHTKQGVPAAPKPAG